MIIVVVGVLLAIVLGYMLWPRPSTSPESTGEDFQAFEGGERSDAPEPRGPEPGPDAASKAGGEEREGSVVVLEDRVERPEDAPPAGAREPDAGPDQAERADAGYVDPVNEEVLGPKAWMPELPEDEREEIDEELDRQSPDPFPIDLGVRREGIEVAKAVVFDCYDALRRRQPQRTGRIIVSFDVVASGGSATLENTEVPTNVKLDDPQFEACIIDGIDGLQIASSDEGTMRVKYPFLFDLEGKR
ncbi:MAG: hypothetical protein ACQEVA_18540 [Myxococcota bacterium]